MFGRLSVVKEPSDGKMFIEVLSRRNEKFEFRVF
jgi:hypothetical protein